ncbi:MAG: GNAT family protein [Sneathiella sp.]
MLCPKRRKRMKSLSMTFGTKIDQKSWPFPNLDKIEGSGITLEPLERGHLADLWVSASADPSSFDYLRYGPFNDKDELGILLDDLSSRVDQPFWAVIPKGGKAEGWLSICDIYQGDGSIEIGSIWFSSSLQGTRFGREAIFLLMCRCMDELAYERLVWRCQAQNEKSFRAAESFGFRHEGTWRNAAVVKGWQRDVAWFSILKEEWPVCRKALLNWFLPGNFDAVGRQIKSLRALREQIDMSPE